jgi:hypothetical protein
MRLRFLALVPVLGPFLWLACSSSSTASSSPAVIPDAALGGACGAAVVTSPPKSANHVPVGSSLTYSTNPPCGGDHYPIWATWGAHTKPLPAGYWVHNQEHGGVVMLYRCADRAACPALAAQVEAVAAALPHDPTCDPSILTRVVVLPDPDLPAGVQIAAAAWGYSWTATCFDGARLRSFAEAAMRHGPEDECAQGAVGDDAPTSDAGADAADAAAPVEAGSEAGDASGE